ncbi:MAG TPA: laccase domain-containing protein, partial [Candidatus Acidoferrales bacterium]|nr:laccase domain-containing protein [Candidatus Acidoferrales bacterium]
MHRALRLSSTIYNGTVPMLSAPKTVARLNVLQAAALKKIPWLVHGFSTRSGGFTTAYGGRTLNLGFTKDDTRENVERNRAKLLLSIGAGEKRNPWPLVSLRQIHSDLIHV